LDVAKNLLYAMTDDTVWALNGAGLNQADQTDEKTPAKRAAFLQKRL